jgi:hypothetical protein
MAKKINLDEIDESFIVAAVRKDRITPEITPPPLAPLGATVPVVQTEQSPKEETVTQPEPPHPKTKGNGSGTNRIMKPCLSGNRTLRHGWGKQSISARNFTTGY